VAEQKQQQRISGDKLRAFIAASFEAVAIPRDDAKAIAQLMAQADINGSEGHGIFRLPQYIRRIKGGAVNVKPNIRVEREMAGMALVHGDNGMGHLVMKFATEKAIEKAKTAGVAWVGARWSNHAGPASLYASMPLAHNMIGLYMAVGSANHLPPWGGLDMLLSTNPIAVAVPAGEEPAIILDMATTVAAYGKVKTKAQRGDGAPLSFLMVVARLSFGLRWRARSGFTGMSMSQSQVVLSEASESISRVSSRILGGYMRLRGMVFMTVEEDSKKAQRT
jgi:LDH2 family malate/lactate/ureidoglycolate dehydrogenase